MFDSGEHDGRGGRPRATAVQSGFSRGARLILAVFVVALPVVPVACGDDAGEADAASRAIDLICDLTYSCHTPMELGMILAAHPILGHSQPECRRLHQDANYGTPEGCPVGEVFQPERLDACITALEGSSCSDWSDPPLWPVACSFQAEGYCAPP